jgi:hypothetical protein
MKHINNHQMEVVPFVIVAAGGAVVYYALNRTMGRPETIPSNELTNHGAYLKPQDLHSWIHMVKDSNTKATVFVNHQGGHAYLVQGEGMVGSSMANHKLVREMQEDAAHFNVIFQ